VHVADEVEAHARELAQMPVVRERHLHAREAERVQVRLRQHLVLAAGDSADMRDHAPRGHLLGEAARASASRRAAADALHCPD
jgi:hypothetical protein